MAISEEWLPVIAEGVSWVKDKFGPSKKELEVRVSDLEKQVHILVAGNATLVNSLGLITQAILQQLKSDDYTINADTIVFVGENSGYIDIPQSIVSNSFTSGDVVVQEQKADFNISKIFDGIDQEIAHSRISKPSERR